MSREKSSLTNSESTEAELLWQQRAICSEYQQRVDDVLMDMQAYTFAVSQLLEAKSKLAKSLEAILALPRTGSGLWDYASSWVDATGIQVASEPEMVVAQLKMAANGAQKMFMAQFANINSILSHYDANVSKPGLCERVLEDLKSFNEQRMISLEGPIVELLNLEYNIGLGMNSSRMVEKLAEAQQIFHAGQSQPLPKTELVLEPLLRNVHTVHYLREFYEAEYSIENLDLWFAVERFRQTSDAKQRAIEAENIYETYICENAPRQVNLPMKLVKTLAKNVKERDPTDENEPASDIFDECAKECFTLLQSRFEKFVSSKFGQALRARLRDVRPFEQYVEAKSDPDISATMRKIKKLRSRGASVAEKDTGVIRQTPQTYLTTDVHFVLGEKFKVSVKPTALLRVNNETWCAFQDGTIVCYTEDKDKGDTRTARTLVDPKDSSPACFMTRLGPGEVLTQHEEGMVKVWDITKGKVYAKAGGKNSFYSVVHKTGDNTFWAASTKQLTSFTYKKKKLTIDLTREMPRVVTSILRVQNVIWIGDNDGGLSRLNIQTMQPIGQRIRDQSRGIHLLHKVETASSKGTFSTLNRYVWTAARDCTMCIYSEDFNLLRKITVGHQLPVTSFTMADCYVATSSEDHNVILWKKELKEDSLSTNGSDLVVERLPSQHKDSVNSICYATDTDQLWTASSDRTVAIWKRYLKKGRLERVGSSLASGGGSTSASAMDVERSSDSISSNSARSAPVLKLKDTPTSSSINTPKTLEAESSLAESASADLTLHDHAESAADSSESVN